MLLVLAMEVEDHVESLARAGERIKEPGGEAVGIHRDGDLEWSAGFGVDLKSVQGFGLEKVYLARIAEQYISGLGERHGRGASYQLSTGCLLHCLHPLGTEPRVAVTTVLALTWLNPHVSLDTVLFLGSVDSQQGTSERWWWVGGAVTASILWFGGLGFGARLLRPVFARPVAWRVLDALIAVVMITLGLRLALGH